MINVKRLTVISLCAASTCVGNAMPQTQETAIGTQQQDSTQTLPAQWNLQACIDYALQQNITIRKNRLNAKSAEVDVKTVDIFPKNFFIEYRTKIKLAITFQFFICYLYKSILYL